MRTPKCAIKPKCQNCKFWEFFAAYHAAPPRCTRFAASAHPTLESPVNMVTRHGATMLDIYMETPSDFFCAAHETKP